MNDIEVIDNYLPRREHQLIYDYFTGALDKGDNANSCAWTFFLDVVCWVMMIIGFILLN